MSLAPINIKLRCSSWQQLANIYRRDLSRHAIFLKSSAPPPVGTPVRIDLTLPTESMIVLAGVIHEHVPEGGLGGRGPGVDIKLNTIPESALWLIETALASAQKQAGAAPSPPAGSAGSGPTAAAPADASVDDSADLLQAEDELLAALTSELESLRKLNPFQVLGVGYEADDADVRAAFAGLTKRYHPDRFTRYTSQELRGMAAEIFILIRDAYRRLNDEASRAKALAAAGARPSVRVPTLRPGGAPVAMPAGSPPAGAPRPVLPAIPPPPAVSPAAVSPATPPPRPNRAPSNAEPTVAARPPDTDRKPMQIAPPPLTDDGGKADFRAAESLLDSGRYDEALAVFKIYARKNPGDRSARAGIELSEGLRALAQRDRLEAAQRFEAVLEIDPTNERAARELAEMRRMATNERRGLLSRLMGKKE